MRMSKLLYAVMRFISFFFLILSAIYLRHLGAVLIVPMLSKSSRDYGSLRGLFIGWVLTVLCIPSFFLIQKKVFLSRRISARVCSFFFNWLCS